MEFLEALSWVATTSFDAAFELEQKAPGQKALQQ